MHDKGIIEKWYKEVLMKGIIPTVVETQWESFQESWEFDKAIILMKLARKDEVRKEQKRLRKKVVARYEQKKREEVHRPLYRAGRLAGLMDSLWLLGMKLKPVKIEKTIKIELGDKK